MATIFVSYRHGRSENWAAGRLEEALAREFDIFFDTDIGAGEVWERRLQRELGECRVFIAAIGSEWCKSRNLNRLRDVDDWVRKEILGALARKGSVTIVPVFIELERQLQRIDLPEELSPLLDYEAEKLTHKNWKTDVARLLESLQFRLAGSAPRRAGLPVPPVLPHLCDRAEPEQRLGDVIDTARSATRTFAVVLHGHKAERHGGFLDRLVYNGELESALRARATGVAVHHLEWNGEYARRGRFDALLRRGIKKQVLGDSNATDAQLVELLSSSRQTLVFVLQVTWADIEECSSELLPNLAAAWQALFAGGSMDPAVVSPYSAVLWINLSYDTGQNVTPGALGDAIIELRPLEERHIREWLEMPKVRPYVVGREPEVRRIAADPGNWCERGKIHMEQFEVCVRQTLEKV